MGLEVIGGGAGGAAGAFVLTDGSYAAAGTDVLSARVVADAAPRFTLDADGTMHWGAGAGAFDVALARSGAAALGLTGSLLASGILSARTGAAAQVDIGDEGPTGQAGILLDGDVGIYLGNASTVLTHIDFGAGGVITALYGTPSLVEIGNVGPSGEPAIRWRGDTNLYATGAGALSSNATFHASTFAADNYVRAQLNTGSETWLGSYGPAGESAVRFLGDTVIWRAAARQVVLGAGAVTPPTATGDVVLIPNVTAAPSTNPVGGGALYVDAGALKYRGTAGTVTVIAPA